MDDDDEVWVPFYGVGSATPGPAPTAPPCKTVAVLWVPDIDARHRWREHYVAQQEPQVKTPNHRPAGFAGQMRGRKRTR